MSDEMQQWEYRVQTVGSIWTGVKADDLQELLNAWGVDGWEVISTHLLENQNKINVIAKRPLTREALRRRSMPKS